MAPDTERWEEHDAALKQFSKEIGDLVADDLNAASDAAAEVQTIYHYTDVASALAIIESGRFCLPSARISTTHLSCNMRSGSVHAANKRRATHRT
jgi:hypothetical protein